MKYPHLQRRLCKVCALVAATLILPALAYAGTDNGINGNGGTNNGNQYGKDKNGDPGVTWTPEANTGIVLIPFFGAVLLFGTYHLLRRQKNASL